MANPFSSWFLPEKVTVKEKPKVIKKPKKVPVVDLSAIRNETADELLKNALKVDDTNQAKLLEYERQKQTNPKLQEMLDETNIELMKQERPGYQLPAEEPAPLPEKQKSDFEKYMEMLRDQGSEKSQLQKQLRDAAQNAIDVQQQGLDTSTLFQQQLAGVSPQLDISPAISLTDTWTGSKMLPGYQKPLSIEERLAMNAGMQDKVQKQKENAAESQIALLKAAEGGGGLGDMIKMMQNDRAERRYAREGQKEIGKAFDAATKDLDEVAARYQSLQGTLRTGNREEIRKATAQFARLIMDEKGALSDSDIARVITPSLLNSWLNLKSYLFSEQKQPVTQREIDSMVALVNRTRNEVQQGYKRRVQTARDRFLVMPEFSDDPSVENLYNIYSKKTDAFGGDIAAPVMGKKTGAKKATGKPWDFFKSKLKR